MTTLVWFRQDLRTADNPALSEAAARGKIVPVFVLEPPDHSGETHPLGGASRWWLHHALKALKEELPGLVLLRGSARHAIPEFAAKCDADAVYWNRCYEPHAIERDTDLKTYLKKEGLEVRSFKASLLFEPWELETGSGGPYKVYSPFWKAALQGDVPPALPRPETIRIAENPGGEPLEDLELLPTKPNWARGWEDLWTPGARGASERLGAFLDEGLKGYGDKRNRPDLPNVSRLSPHLHFGDISPRQVWSATQHAGRIANPVLKRRRQVPLGNRLARVLLSSPLSFPAIAGEKLAACLRRLPVARERGGSDLWQTGLTGYPMVDAGMRELWQTGYMHNRVRMLAGSFLVKHLRLDWKHGEAWFRDTLVDADLANNSASWQWVAGSGADAAPYFRIFNPISQGPKFDPDGKYVRRWLPELAKLPTKHLFSPFEAPASVLRDAGVRLGDTYPYPIVDHGMARQAALAGYEDVKTAGQDAA
jgi:deoxyribodipyrimidine photo-lyase